MVLEKDGHEPAIYIGSSVEVCQGIQARLNQHKRGAQVPFRVKQYKDEGYRLVHIAILTYMQIPTAPQRARFKGLIAILEACFHYVFWSMWSKDKLYSFPTFNESRWLPASFPYRGLCTHNPLIEHFEINPQLSADELIEIDRAKKEHKIERLRVYRQTRQANPAREEVYKEQQRLQSKARSQNIIASNKYHCSTCSKSFPCAAHLQRHNASSSHKKRTKGLESGDDRYYCAPCNIYIYRQLCNINQHNKSKRHLRETQG